MTDPATIETPLEPWVNAPASMTPDGALHALVGLADVVRWLMTAKRLHIVSAVHAMHKALAGLDGLGLYVTDGKGRARAVGAADAFGLDIPSGRRTLNRGIDMPRPERVQSRPLPDGVTPGVSAALYMVLHQPNEPGALILCLAMPCKQAAALWSGVSLAEVARPLSWVDLVAVRKADPGAEWTPFMLEALISERGNRHKQKGAAKSMAADLGLSVKRVNELLADDERKRKPAGKKLQNVWPPCGRKTG